MLRAIKKAFVCVIYEAETVGAQKIRKSEWFFLCELKCVCVQVGKMEEKNGGGAQLYVGEEPPPPPQPPARDVR